MPKRPVELFGKALPPEDVLAVREPSDNLTIRSKARTAARRPISQLLHRTLPPISTAGVQRTGSVRPQRWQRQQEAVQSLRALSNALLLRELWESLQNSPLLL